VSGAGNRPTGEAKVTINMEKEKNLMRQSTMGEKQQPTTVHAHDSNDRQNDIQQHGWCCWQSWT